MSNTRKKSYGEILRSTAIIGGSSAANIVINIARAKIVAVVLGPAGVGLNGIFGSISSLSESLAGLGINNSGVRQIAEAVGSNDSARISTTALVLRRTSVFLGILGALSLVLFSNQISRVTFGTDAQAAAICVLAAGLLCRVVASGQGALLQGTRRIAEVSKTAVFSTLTGALLTIPLIYWLREDGVAWALAASSAAGLYFSWFYSRKLLPGASNVKFEQVRGEVAGLLKLGSAFLVSGLMTLGSAYAIRALIFQQLGDEAAGLYQAAWSVGGMYVGFILQSMASDFYPRLAATGRDDEECNRLVNEQALVSLLLAAAGILLTITLSPLVVRVLYSESFGPAVSVLRWICVGTALQVISWPMGFILVARNAQTLFLLSDGLWTAIHIGLAWFGLTYFGLDGAGIAYCGAYFIHIAINHWMASRLTGFRWSALNFKIGMAYLGLIAFTFGAFSVLPFPAAIATGMVTSAAAGFYSIRMLAALAPIEKVPARLRRVLISVRLLPQVSVPEEVDVNA